LEPDTLMIAPHLGAIYLAWRRKPLAAGILAGVAFLLSPKALFVLASCVLFGGLPWLALSFIAVNLVAAAWLASNHALSAYWEQVWQWGFHYIGTSPPNASLTTGIASFIGWFGFHAALCLAAAWYILREKPPRLTAWFLVSLAGTGLGFHFAPRYINQLLPPLVILAGCGLAQLFASNQRHAALAAALRVLIVGSLIVPIIRFGPSYVELARDDLARRGHSWRDVAMDQESRAAAAIVEVASRPGDTIFIWGYRPNIIAYTRLPVAGKFWDSQPLTGVPADRHLSTDVPVSAAWARDNRLEFVQSPAPIFVIDGLSRYNPSLDIHRFPELSDWMRQYCEVGEAGATTIYRLCVAR